MPHGGIYQAVRLIAYVRSMRWALRFLFPAKNMREQREQVLRTFENLRKQIPLLYAVTLVNAVGVHLATGGNAFEWFSPLTLLGALLLWRMIFWIVFQRPTHEFRVARRELVKMVCFTALLGVGFSLWVQSLLTQYPDKSLTILLYSLLAALGAAYGLSSFPRAALLPLIIMGFPLAVRVFLMEGHAAKGIGVSLVLVLGLFTWLLQVHSRALTGLVSGQIALGRERNRAVAAELEAVKRADEDALTGLANRGRLVREIRDHLVRGPGPGGGSVLAICDLDGFKSANDAFGHAAGDQILKEFATRLQREFADRALVARLGGDEFSIFWKDGLSGDQIEEVGSRVCELASKPVAWDGKELSVGASCGLTEAGPYTSSESEFFRQADSALYKAKASLRGHWHLYDQPQFEADQRRANIEKLILSGSAAEQMHVVFQPIFCVETGQPVFAEALARWDSPDLGIVAPDEFIRIAEKLGVIDRLNEELLDKALTSVADWPTNLALSFNLSAMQLGRSASAERIRDIVRAHSLPPERVQFEITETALLTDLEHAAKELKKLSGFGFTIALDDFGSGYASVSYLTELSFETIKLDGSLIDNVLENERTRQILLGLVDLCHAAGAQCVAEHIETRDQYRLARAMGCDFVQGFCLGKPTTSEKMLEALGLEGGPSRPPLGRATKD